MLVIFYYLHIDIDISTSLVPCFPRRSARRTRCWASEPKVCGPTQRGGRGFFFGDGGGWMVWRCWDWEKHGKTWSKSKSGWCFTLFHSDLYGFEVLQVIWVKCFILVCELKWFTQNQVLDCAELSVRRGCEVWTWTCKQKPTLWKRKFQLK